MKNNILKKIIVFIMVFSMTFTMILPTSFLKVFAAENYIIVDDTETNNLADNYFTYSSATDPTGLKGWASDTKQSIIGESEAKTQHWVWTQDSSEAIKHTYEFTFKGTGVEIVGVKNDNVNNFQLDNGEIEAVTITGSANTPVTLYSKKNLNYGVHTVKVTLPQGCTGLQVSYAKVFGTKDVVMETTTIPHTKKVELIIFLSFLKKVGPMQEIVNMYGLMHLLVH